ncbi:MAG: Hsp33 family molecular chaperone HslO [Gammaproteobacteria bacterium]|nr:Hsp33 family molecular chaperone HslO [Gammaproteobacteria bacterium]MDH5729065.1 Hsp33 family molecular chaperone HslO [Gammaproteobacteria bacterium]
MKETDRLRRFLFEQAAIRGAVVHLDATWKAIHEKSNYPPVVAQELAQFLSASALLSSMLKFDGSMILQVQGDGQIPLLVMEAVSDGSFRGLAHWRGEVEPGNLEALFGSGRLVITIDRENVRERYQGIVELKGENLAQALQQYMMQSEQLETFLWLSSDLQQTAGLLIQKMPGAHDEDQDAWNRVTQLANTISDEELLNLSAEEILHRLFHEDDIRLYDAEPLSFRCTCTRERVTNMLKTLGPDEVHSILEEQGSVSVDCQFCNQHYEFDKVDAELIFAAADGQPSVPPTKH